MVRSEYEKAKLEPPLKVKEKVGSEAEKVTVSKSIESTNVIEELPPKSNGPIGTMKVELPTVTSTPMMLKGIGFPSGSKA